MGSCQVDLGKLSLFFETRQSSFLTDMQVLINLKEQLLVNVRLGFEKAVNQQVQFLSI